MPCIRVRLAAARRIWRRIELMSTIPASGIRVEVLDCVVLMVTSVR
jgi:hypothetical protein